MESQAYLYYSRKNDGDVKWAIGWYDHFGRVRHRVLAVLEWLLLQSLGGE